MATPVLYRPGDHVNALRHVDGSTILAAAFVVTAQPAEDDNTRTRLVVEFLANGERRTFHGAAINDYVVPA